MRKIENKFWIFFMTLLSISCKNRIARLIGSTKRSCFRYLIWCWTLEVSALSRFKGSLKILCIFWPGMKKVQLYSRCTTTIFAKWKELFSNSRTALKCFGRKSRKGSTPILRKKTHCPLFLITVFL